eukprot:GDKH01023850.1.p1 GENE.GDKH01023850.1~~GDKH01023850.1.p1  ORF type:complete len:90 (-),score=13.76 GDKH01023850.1:108-377(-)
MFSLTRRCLASFPVPTFATGRAGRRLNMSDRDRALFFHTNLFAIFLTMVPVSYLLTARTNVSPETEQILLALGGNKALDQYDESLFVKQ